MNNMRAIITRTIIAASVAICAIVAVPDLTFACNLERDLVHANLSGCYLRGADLVGADLSRAYLIGANLSYADLSYAYLRGADFTGADLTDAFRRPGISRADMDGVIGLDTVTGLVD